MCHNIGLLISIKRVNQRDLSSGIALIGGMITLRNVKRNQPGDA